jgi:hypothetical protein
MKLLIVLLALLVTGPVLAQTYTYSIADDFPPAGINPSNLKHEIDDSAIASATLLSINTEGDVATLTFSGALSSGDKTVLDGDTTGPAGGLIAAHDTTQEPFEWQKASQASEITTDSADWEDVISGPLRMTPGWYKITTSYLCGTSDTGSAVSLKLLKDDVTVWATDEALPNANSALEYPRAYVFIGQVTELEKPTWKLQWKRTGGSGTIFLRKAFLLVERMPSQ